MHTFVRPSTFTLEDVDRKLKAAKFNLPTVQQFTPPDSSSEDGSSPETDYFPELPSDEVRPLEQCIAIFEKGPRPVSASLALLNDEEVIQLANAGKIAAYALEKLLGMDALERAVRIRRALICGFLRPFVRTLLLLT
jgi:hydroxymethylglutaryl-CoA reductase (NADPH)